MRRRLHVVAAVLTIVLLAWAAPPASAATTVVPNANSVTPGSNGNQFPFGCGSNGSGIPSMRYQQVYFGREVGAGRISQIGFRTTEASPTFTLSNVTIMLSTTSKSVTGLDTTFANNVGTDVVTVFSGNLTVSNPAPTSPPTQSFGITLQTPFNFDPKSGNLLLDITIPTCVNSSSSNDWVVTSTAANVVTSRLTANLSTSPTGTYEGNSGYWSGLITIFTTGAAPPPANCVSGSQPGTVYLTAGGNTCVAPGTQIGGNLIIGRGVNATITGATIGGNVVGTEPGAVSLCGSTVRGSVDISRATGFVLIGDPGDASCAPNSITGAVRLDQNTAGTEVSRNTRIGSTVLTGNNGPRNELEANTINGSLSCSGNNPAINNNSHTNTVSGSRSGECVGL